MTEQNEKRLRELIEEEWFYGGDCRNAQEAIVSFVREMVKPMADILDTVPHYLPEPQNAQDPLRCAPNCPRCKWDGMKR